MKKLIVIFSYKFPFEPPTEQFLLEEVKSFMNDDWEIILIPTSRTVDERKAYFLDDVHCVRAKRYSKYLEVIVGASCLFRKSFWQDVFQSVRKQTGGVLLNKIRESLYQHWQIAIRVKSFDQIRARIDFSKYKKIVFYSYWLGPMTVAAIRIARKHFHNNKITVISRAHGDGDLYLSEKVGDFRPGIKEMSDYGVRVFTISDGGKNLLLQQGLTNVITSRLGVKNNYILTEYSQSNDTFNIVSCSTVNDNKRVSDIAKSIFLIDNTKIKWTHFGGGERLEYIKKWCNENSKDNIEVNLPGYVDHEVIMNYYHNNSPDLFINLSMIEGIPVSIMEAMSFGIPCIATNVGATSEIVNSCNGFLIDREYEIETIKDLIKSYVELPDNIKTLYRSEARRTWETKYNSPKNFESFVRDIDVIINH